MQEQRQDDQIACQAAEHGEAHQDAEIDGRHELAEGERREADDQCQRGEH